MKRQKKNTANTAFPNDDPPVIVEQNEKDREIMKHEKILIKNRKNKINNKHYVDLPAHSIHSPPTMT